MSHTRLGEDNRGIIHTEQVTKSGKKLHKVYQNGRWFTLPA